MKADLATTRGTCASCAHWEPNAEKTCGMCVRFPPVVISDEEGISTVFPITEADERCGEHLAGQ